MYCKVHIRFLYALIHHFFFFCFANEMVLSVSAKMMGKPLTVLYLYPSLHRIVMIFRRSMGVVTPCNFPSFTGECNLSGLLIDYLALFILIACHLHKFISLLITRCIETNLSAFQLLISFYEQ